VIVSVAASFSTVFDQHWQHLDFTNRSLLFLSLEYV